MENLVSIIIPYFNRGYIFGETLNAVLKQTYDNWEIIIVDDGSTEEELKLLNELISNDKRIKLLQRTTSIKGPSACRNLGIKNAAGKYLLFLDSDDIITADCLYNRLNFMQQNPALDFAVFTQAQFHDKTGSNEIYSKFYPSKNEYLENFLKDNHPWQTSAPIWKTESIQKLGGFREDYTIMEDPELHIRALLSNMQFEVVKSDPDFYYRITNKTPAQEKEFWANSIYGRVRFFEDTLVLLQKNNAWPKYKTPLSKGYNNFVKFFLLARSNEYPEQLQRINTWAKKNNMVSSYKLWLINLYAFINKKPNSIGLVLRKGLVYKLI